jgi:sugar-specific transcriptional regulator TrmB
VISINKEFFAKAKRLAIEEAAVQTLTRLGLTISQAKVYFDLLRLEKATVNTISKHSKMARQQVYRVLAELQEKGLVEKIIEIPTEFKPIPIEDCMYILIERKKNEVFKNQKEATVLLQRLIQKKTKNTLQEDEAQLRLISERATVLREKGRLKAVQRSIDEVTSWKNPHTTMFIDMDDLTEALQRGVKIRVIIDKPSEEKLLTDITKQLKKHPTFKIRYLPNAPKALISVYDKKEAWICTCTQPVRKDCPSLWTNNPCLLAILQDYFEMLWLTAMEAPENLNST